MTNDVVHRSKTLLRCSRSSYENDHKTVHGQQISKMAEAVEKVEHWPKFTADLRSKDMETENTVVGLLTEHSKLKKHLRLMR